MPGKVTYTNIVVGAAKLFVGPDQFTVDYDVITALKGDDSVYNVGATQDGVSVSWEPDMIDIEVDQFGDAARIITNKQKIVIKTTLAEATLQNLANAWGYSTGVTATKPGLVTPFSATSGTFNVGIASTYPAEKYTRIEGSAPGSSQASLVYRTYKNRRCISYTASEHGMKKDDNVKFALEFRVLPDNTQTGKEYGTIVDSSTVPYTPYI